jgi:hypothetical protein
MRKNFLYGLLISLAFPFLASAVNAQTPTFAFTGSGSCLNSTSNFNSDFTPGSKSANIWTNTFATVGSGIASNGTSTVTENAEYTNAVPGSGKFAPPQAGASTITHTDTSTGPNSDGSFAVQVGTLTETFTAGPQTGLTATVTFPTGLTVKQWQGTNGTAVMAGTSPVVETVTLSNGTIWYRICVRSVVVTPL